MGASITRLMIGRVDTGQSRARYNHYVPAVASQTLVTLALSIVNVVPPLRRSGYLIRIASGRSIAVEEELQRPKYGVL